MQNQQGRDVAQSGRAQRSGRWGRRFKSSRPDHLLVMLLVGIVFLSVRGLKEIYSR